MDPSKLALAVLRALYLGGVRDVVLAPGSRSTPFAIALYGAHVAADLRLHVRLDERGAGFTALGLTIGSHRPVAVVTTSGTAVGNLLPAVMEAQHGGRALIVVSADRPDRLRGTGANQTTEQAGIFGGFAPCADLRQGSDPDAVAQAALQACRRTGPTQLNIQLNGRLVPSREPWWPGVDAEVKEEEEEAEEAGLAAPDRPDGGVIGRRDHGGGVLGLGPRTVVLAGDDAGPAARLLAEKAQWPLLAEPTSGARVGPAAIRTSRLLLGTSLRAEIERVVVIGHPTLSRPAVALISDPDLEILSVPTRAGTPTDPGRIATILAGVPDVDGPDDPAWLARWTTADAALSAAVDAQVDEWADALADTDTGACAEGRLHPLVVSREVAAAVGPQATLVVGSSSPVRDLDLMMTPYPPQQRRLVVGNRGLSGIDGTVSTALGVALGRRGPGRRLAVMGDVTFLHDATALFLGPDEPRPDLTIVVANDDGGSIFSLLEQGAPEYAAAFERVFATPHHSDLAALCAASGTSYRLVSTVPALREVLRGSPVGIEVVEVRVPRAARREHAAALAALARRTIDAEGPS